MLAAAVVEVLYAAAPALLVMSVIAGALAVVAGALHILDTKAERMADEEWQEVGVRIDNILAAPWPEAEAVTGPIEVVVTSPVEVITGGIEIPAPAPPCLHLSRLDRADGLRCPECDA